MVLNTRDRDISLTRNETARKGKIDKVEVVLIRPHVLPYPDDKDFNTVDVQLINRLMSTGEAENEKKLIQYVKLTSIQQEHGKFQGHPVTPRIGDMIFVYWLAERVALVLGSAISIEQEPICRSCANDKHQEYVHKLCPWEEPHINDFGNYDIFPDPKHPTCTKWWPVQPDKETLSLDWIQVWDCKNGHDRAACDRLAPCNKLDDIKLRTWVKNFSYTSPTCTDLIWRWKYHHNSESVFLFDQDKTIHLANKKGCSTCSGTGCDGECPTCKGTKLVDDELCPTCEGTGQDVCATCNGAGCTEELGHSHTYPEGTWDIHAGGTQPNKDFVALAAENAGVRVSVVHPDDSSVDFAFEAIDFATGAYIRILKSGEIKLHSPTKITLDAPLVEETQDNLTSGDNEVKGTCTHGACSCGGGA